MIKIRAPVTPTVTTPALAHSDVNLPPRSKCASRNQPVQMPCVQ